MILFMLSLLLGVAHAVEPLPGPVTDEVQATRHAITSGILIPQPLSLGYQVIYPELPNVHFFAEGGYFYLPLSGRLKKASIWSVQAGARYFPLESWWYVSGALGFRQIGIGTDISNLKLDGVSLANNADLTLNAAILGVCVGGEWSLSQNVALSVELGVQLAIPGLHGGSTSIVQDVSDGTDLSVDDSAALRRITSIPLPQIALARFIWYID